MYGGGEIIWSVPYHLPTLSILLRLIVTWIWHFYYHWKEITYIGYRTVIIYYRDHFKFWVEPGIIWFWNYMFVIHFYKYKYISKNLYRFILLCYILYFLNRNMYNMLQQNYLMSQWVFTVNLYICNVYILSLNKMYIMYVIHIIHVT